MISRRLTLLPAAVLLAALAACGGDDGGDGAVAGDTTTTAESTTTTAAEPADDPVELLDAGAEPRSELRLALAPGDTGAQRMVLDLDMELQYGGRTQTIDSPRTIMDLDSEIVDASGGVFTVRSILAAADVEAGEADPAVVEETRRSLQAMIGTTYRQRIDERGISQGVDTPEVPAGVPAEARTMIEQASSQLADLGVAFPADAVGVGARWARRSEATVNGIQFEMRFEYRLAERDGDAYVVDVSYEQRIVPGPIDVPGAGGAVADGGTITGQGQLRGTLDSTVSEGGMQGAGEVRLHVEQGGNRTDLVQHMTVATELSRRS